MLVSYTWSKALTNAASEFDEFSGFDENSFDLESPKGSEHQRLPSECGCQL